MRRLIFTLLTLGLAAPALADVSDSGNLTIGGTGVIQGTMTVQGAAFSVGGSTFAVAGGTVQVGGLLRVSASGIQWSDGTVSTVAASGGGAPQADITTCTTGGFAGSWTNTTFSVAQTTVTFIATGTRKIRVSLSATAENNSSFNSVAASFIQDGAFVAPRSSTVGQKYIVVAGGGGSGDTDIGFAAVLAAPSAGSHTYGLVMRVGGGTGSFTPTTQGTHQFCVAEVP